MKRFAKYFTQQEPIPEPAIARAVEIMRTGRLHRYNIAPGEESEVSALEREFADYQGARYCLACASGGYALHIALRAAGLEPGEPVLANAYTLAPVPGAIHNAGGVPVLVEVDADYHVDLDDLAAKAVRSRSRFLLLSHMRGHVADMDAVTALCRDHGITLIEDCAHTMGARWRGRLSGSFGVIACFSAQTYKHVNAGEGGLLTTDNAIVAARAIVHSGSYMLYDRHGAAPDESVFRRIRLETPNYSGRMDNLRAALLRPQIAALSTNCARWTHLYEVLEAGLARLPGLRLPKRVAHEAFVGSSIQFQVTDLELSRIPTLLAAAAERGVELKWFGDDEPKGFTSRFDSWRYLGDLPDLPQTRAVLSRTCDMRIPLTFTEADCRLIVDVIAEALAEIGATTTTA